MRGIDYIFYLKLHYLFDILIFKYLVIKSLLVIYSLIVIYSCILCHIFEATEYFLLQNVKESSETIRDLNNSLQLAKKEKVSNKFK